MFLVSQQCVNNTNSFLQRKGASLLSLHFACLHGPTTSAKNYGIEVLNYNQYVIHKWHHSLQRDRKISWSQKNPKYDKKYVYYLFIENDVRYALSSFTNKSKHNTFI